MIDTVWRYMKSAELTGMHQAFVWSARIILLATPLTHVPRCCFFFLCSCAVYRICCQVPDSDACSCLLATVSPEFGQDISRSQINQHTVAITHACSMAHLSDDTRLRNALA